MIKRTSRKAAFAALLGAAALIGLAACDQTDERLQRAQEVAEAAIDQVSGGDAGSQPAGPTLMSDVPVEARAFAGAMLEPTVNVQMVEPRSRFAVGSIIAKPRDLPPLPSPAEALAIQQPELATELEPEIAAARAMEVEIEEAEAEVEAEAREGRILARRLPDSLPSASLPEGILSQPLDDSEAVRRVPRRGDVRMPVNLPRDQEIIARRAVVTPEALRVQTDARTLMLDQMSAYGLSGQVELGRDGQMVIQIGSDGADPTQMSTGSDSPQLFTPMGATRPDLPQIAVQSDDVRCPENPDPAVMRRNPVLATACLVDSLSESGQFEYVERDFIFDHQFVRRPRGEPPVRVAVEPNDALWSLQWHFFNNGTGAGESPGGAGFVDFWTDQGTTGSRDVVVAVIDTGLDLDHPDISSSLNVAPGWDMVSDPRMGNDGDGRDPDANDPGDLCDPTIPFAEDSFHGTHVAGTIGAAMSNNTAGVAGGAWNVKIVPVRALGKCGGRLTDINDAIRWAGGLVPAIDAEGNEVWNANPADIINLSIGLFEFCPASLQEAINAVSERGVVVVSAAGNARIDTRYYSPGGCQNVISVAAGDARGQIAPYSNFGDGVDILAPGGDLSRDDNGDGRPDGVLSTRLAGNCFDPVTNTPVSTCFYAFEQGTSMAAPHVSAALALIKSRDQSLMGSALSDVLLGSLAPRTVEQCASPCDEYPGATPSESDPSLCLRPCGGGLLDLSNVSFDTGEDD